MTGGSRIIAIGTGAEQAASETTAPEEAEALAPQVLSEEEWLEEDAPVAATRGWIAPLLAGIAVLGWSGFFLWANDWLASGVTPREAISLVTSWAVPVLLMSVVWLLAMRNSRREALRFGGAARLLSDESARLEERLTVVNRELSLAREFLASQSRDLEALGRIAGERLSAHADKLQSLVRDNGAQVESIATVSSTALDNMERLRGQLPVIASSAKDAANNIATAGRTANTHVQELVEGFRRINDFGVASQQQVQSLREKVDESLDGMGLRLDELRQLAEARFAEIDTRSADLRARLDSDEVEALAAIRSRAAALGEELGATRQSLDAHEADSLAAMQARLAMLREEADGLAEKLRDGESTANAALMQSIRALESHVVETLGKLEALDRQAMEGSRQRVMALGEEARNFDERLAQRNQAFTEEMARRTQEAAARNEEESARIKAQLASIDEVLRARRSEHEAHVAVVAENTATALARIDEAANRIATIVALGRETEDRLDANLRQLADRLGASQHALASTDAAVARVTDHSVRLLELIQASNEHSREHLPAAIAAGEERLATFEARVHQISTALDDAGRRGDELAAAMIETRGGIVSALEDIAGLHGALGERAGEHGETLAALRSNLEALDSDSTRIAERAREELSFALERLADATRQAVQTIEHSSRGSITAVSERLGEESANAIDRVMRMRMAEAVGRLEEAAGHAAGVSRESAMQLRDQLARIDELTGNLERRVTRAREKAEEQVDNDFSRRVALITEALNSNAIDIAKALSSDVTDTAWASYLRGDRGVFTRRAVRLLETQEARSITQIYEDDPEFREHVSRFIHDFEAMLRELLSTRDGHALSVTLLSSDMGKLYVALAQAIERLRN